MTRTRDFLGQEWNIECMGCAVANGTISVPGGIIQKTDHFVVHQDPLIPLPGFLVIASLRHIQSMAEMTNREDEEFAHLLKTTHHAIKEMTKIEHLTIIQEESSIHFHMWFFPWTNAVVEKFGPPSLSKIRDIMVDLRKQILTQLEWKELEKSINGIKALISET
jgi:diadenosine tetraphosphate (Ap4A) HIT family hydrolase